MSRKSAFIPSATILEGEDAQRFLRETELSGPISLERIQWLRGLASATYTAWDDPQGITPEYLRNAFAGAKEPDIETANKVIAEIVSKPF